LRTTCPPAAFPNHPAFDQFQRNSAHPRRQEPDGPPDVRPAAAAMGHFLTILDSNHRRSCHPQETRCPVTHSRLGLSGTVPIRAFLEIPCRANVGPAVRRHPLLAPARSSAGVGAFRWGWDRSGLGAGSTSSSFRSASQQPRFRPSQARPKRGRSAVFPTPYTFRVETECLVRGNTP